LVCQPLAGRAGASEAGHNQADDIRIAASLAVHTEIIPDPETGWMTVRPSTKGGYGNDFVTNRAISPQVKSLPARRH
jgi:hypothetical protein